MPNEQPWPFVIREKCEKAAFHNEFRHPLIRGTARQPPAFDRADSAPADLLPATMVSAQANTFDAVPSFMTPDISEFSYGFALTQELIALAGDARAGHRHHICATLNLNQKMNQGWELAAEAIRTVTDWSHRERIGLELSTASKHIPALILCPLSAATQ
jgi:hypothetical protein